MSEKSEESEVSCEKDCPLTAAKGARITKLDATARGRSLGRRSLSVDSRTNSGYKTSDMLLELRLVLLHKGEHPCEVIDIGGLLFDFRLNRSVNS